MTRIGLIGAGYIARVHADAIAALPGLTVSAVVDPNLAAAERLAASIGARAFATAGEASGLFDRAHVLVPPDLHAPVALPLLQAGVPVLLEKPLAASAAECATLTEAGGGHLGVNQNFVHHPAFARLRSMVETGRIGRLRSVSCVYHVPLRQLAARQFGHWMFRRPMNLLLEQLVHPLSQLAALAGLPTEVRVMPGPAREIAPGLPFVASLDAMLTATVPVHLRFAVGESFPFWRVEAVGTDGVASADMLADRTLFMGRTSLLEQADQALSGLATAAGLAGASIGNLTAYAFGMAGLRPRSDAFFASMKGSIAAFHAALDAGRPPVLDGAFGAALVRVCEEMAAGLPTVTPRPPPRPPAPSADVAVLGGTGFIGAAAVEQLLAAGRTVRVMARNLGNLPALFDRPGVSLVRGDITDPARVAEAVTGSPVVVNLAHGGGGANYEAVRRAMVGGAETVASACQAARVRRLVHIGSIASLYLGPQAEPVTGKTPPDPMAEQRADYARAKAVCDLALLGLHRAQGLPLVILRPGLVVGEGTAPFHSGVGLYNNEQHCVGWNDGRNPLPFVLVEDVASAIVAACDAPGIEGRCYNLVGDVRPSARDYTAQLAAALGRPLRYHPQSATRLWLEDVGKWAIKRVAGRQVAMPARRDFVSRGLEARFDCGDAKADLGWTPNGDPAVFAARAIAVHATP